MTSVPFVWHVLLGKERDTQTRLGVRTAKLGSTPNPLVELAWAALRATTMIVLRWALTTPRPPHASSVLLGIIRTKGTNTTTEGPWAARHAVEGKPLQATRSSIGAGTARQAGRPYRIHMSTATSVVEGDTRVAGAMVHATFAPMAGIATTAIATRTMAGTVPAAAARTAGTPISKVAPATCTSARVAQEASDPTQLLEPLHATPAPRVSTLVPRTLSLTVTSAAATTSIPGMKQAGVRIAATNTIQTGDDPALAIAATRATRSGHPPTNTAPSVQVGAIRQATTRISGGLAHAVTVRQGRRPTATDTAAMAAQVGSMRVREDGAPVRIHRPTIM